MKNKKKTIFILSFVLLVSISIFSFKVLDDGDDFEIAKSFDIFHNVIREIRLFYVDDADISKLINESTTELLEKLDPYTIFYPESEIEDFTFMTTGAYGGIGAMIIERDNKLQLTDVYKDSPADKAGLKIGDEIVKINDIKITEKNISEVKSLLKGEPGSKIHLGIKSFGTQEIKEKNIGREKIVFENIPYSKVFDEKYAYIKLNAFKQGAGIEIKNKLTQMNSKKELQGVILDLRGNPGGLLNEAVNIVSLFVKKKSEIVYTKGRISQWNHTYTSGRDPIFPDIPVVVIINSRSASASEIVAGAIQDLDRGIVIGQRSYGKGLVQTVRKLNYNTRIKITTAKYYIPSGRCIQAIDYSNRNEDGSVGIIPDSLISEFNTSKGRKVYDGGGIKPDIEIEIDILSSFTKHLLEELAIFDFASKFYSENKEIKDAAEFFITDKIYQDFIAYVIKQEVNCTSETYIVAEELLSLAQKEKYNKDVINKIESLKKDLIINKEESLQLYKKQIVQLLEAEIIGRYYYDSGRTISSLKRDKELIEAKRVLEDNDKYRLLLSNINE